MGLYARGIPSLGRVWEGVALSYSLLHPPFKLKNQCPRACFSFEWEKMTLGKISPLQWRF
jgi:hypothetical protein